MPLFPVELWLKEGRKGESIPLLQRTRGKKSRITF